MTAPSLSGPVVVCTYRVQAGGEDAFDAMLADHIPTLRRLGLVTDAPAHVLRHIGDGSPLYVEVFEWVDADAAARASEVPEVIAIWEPMAALCEERDGQPGLQFAPFTSLAHIANEVSS